VAFSYVVAGNALNYHYKTPGQDPYSVANPENPQKPYQGFLAFWHQLHRQLGEQIITADLLRPHLQSVETMRNFFRGINEIPLPELRLECWRDYVRGLDEKFGGNPVTILDEVAPHWKLRAFGDNGLVTAMINSFPFAYWRDYRVFRGQTSYFYKRARLAVLGTHQCAVRTNGFFVPFVEDIDDMGPLAEYQMARILHSPKMRVLLYSPLLEMAIEQGAEIHRGSIEEVMIRMATTAALVYWSEKMALPIKEQDPYLFSISRGLPNKAHYTMTSDY
jgi:hypothetical protein